MTQYAGQNKLATTIPLPDANTPFNASAIGAPIAANRDSIVALTNYGMYKTTLNTAKPPYPLAGVYTNAGTYRLSDPNALIFTSTGVDMLAHSAANRYGRSANLIAHYDDTVWDFLYGAPIRAKYKLTTASSTSPATFEFCLPDGITLEQVIVRLEPATHASLPSVMPRVYVWMTDNTLGTTTLLTPAVSDTSASFVDYNIPHNIAVTLPSTAFSALENSCGVAFYGGSGGGAVADLVVCIPRIEFKRTRIAEEFGEWIP